MAKLKRIVALGISLTLLTVLVLSVDRQKLAEVLRNADLVWFGAALLLFLPQTLAIAHRWKMIASPIAPITLKEAGRQIVASNCLNLVLPSKLGDLAKGVFLFRQGHCRLPDGMHVVVFEKLLDLASLSAWMIIGWCLAASLESRIADALPPLLIYGVLALGVVVIAMISLVYFSSAGPDFLLRVLPKKETGKIAKIRGIVESGPRVMKLVHANSARRFTIVAWSFAIWFLHLLQIYCFFHCLNAEVTAFQVASMVPVAIFAGLLPLTIAGIGVRDWALVKLFETLGYEPAVLVGVSLLISLRYVVPAMMGLPFVSQYFLMSKIARSPEAAAEAQN